MRKTLVPALALMGLAGVASAQTLTLQLLADIDLIDLTGNPTNGKYIGTSPTGVAWNGTDLYVAGWNNTGNAAVNGVARVSNVFGTPSFSNAFGTRNVTAFRGYLDIARKGDIVYTAFENGGSDATNGVQAWDVSGGTPVLLGSFQTAGYRASGVGIDGRTGDVTVSLVASGQRQFILHDDAAVGTQIYGPASTPGFTILPASDANTNWRDVEVDPTTGDVYYRKQNGVWRATRSGDNSASTAQAVLLTGAFATTVGDQAGQSVEIAAGTPAGDVVFFNSRTSGAVQSFGSNFRAVTTGGSTVGITWVGFNPAAVTNGNGWYDYDYDAASGTLAVTDFGNKRVYIFAVPAPGAAAMFGLAALAGARRRR